MPSSRSLPAFTRCSLDDNPGDGDPEVGARDGQSNLYLTWDTTAENVVDEVGRWSLLLKLNKPAPKDACTVDVTPRRCFQFRAREGSKVTWRNVSAEGAELQSGEVEADKWGLVTAPAVQVTRGGNRLTLELRR